MATNLEALIKHDEDHVLILDFGSAEDTGIAVESLGKPFTSVERQAVVIRL